MTKKLIGIFLMVALCTVSSCMAGYEKDFSEVKEKIRKGQPQHAITALIGKPLEIKFMAKSQQFIWGPEEEFWDSIPMGTPLEVWKYDFSEGRLNLYFLNERDRLDYIAFAPNGVIY